MLLDKMTLIYGVPISKNTNSFCPEKAKHNIAFKIGVYCSVEY